MSITTGSIGARRGSARAYVLVDDARVVDAAPILQRTIRGTRDAREAWRRLSRAGWRLTWLPDDESP